MQRKPTGTFSDSVDQVDRARHVTWCALIVFLLVSPTRAETNPLINTLGPEDGESRDDFGNSIAVDNGVAVIGADWKENNRGAVYVMDIATGDTRRKVTAADTEVGDQFGFEVAISGNAAVVGAPFQSHAGTESGAAYVFDVDSFGYSVALDGNLAIVGAPGDDQRGEDAGAAYVLDIATGRQLAKLTSATEQAADFMGWSVDVQDAPSIDRHTDG